MYRRNRKTRSKFDFGRWKNVQETSQEYGGRTISQLQDIGFEVSMRRYLKEKARAIPLPRGRASQLESPATAQEVTGMRGLDGSLRWASREGMPQGAGEASLLASCFPEPKVKDLKEANVSVARLLQQDRLELVVFADSSLENAGGGNSQICHMVCVVHQAIREGREADISCLPIRDTSTIDLVAV